MWEMIEVEVQKVTFRTPKAYLLASKSIAFETQNGTSGEWDWKSLTFSRKENGQRTKVKGRTVKGQRSKFTVYSLLFTVYC